MNQVWFWIAFNLFVVGMLVLDIAVINKAKKPLTMRKSLLMVLMWVSLAIIFNGLVYFTKGPVKALEFFTGYIIELSLSVDNLFVFLVVFAYFNVHKKDQHRILFWGIIGALVLRACFIVCGIAMIRYIAWVNYLFGGILIFTGLRMLLQKSSKPDPEKNVFIRLFKRIIPVTADYHGQAFLIRDENRWKATPLLIVLLVIEMTDLMFAIDSIPAVLAVSKDIFIVYTSNVFAIMGLRSMFSALSGVMDSFKYLKYGLAVILSFVGVKMVCEKFFHIPVIFTLSVILTVLLVSIIASIIAKKKKAAAKR